MLPIALLIVLMNGPVPVAKSHWTAIEINVREHGTTLDCAFEVVQGGSKAQVLLMPRADAERFNRGRSYRALYETGFEESGRFRYRVREAGEYILLLDNRLERRFDTTVHVKVQLHSPSLLNVRTASPERRRVVVTLSLLFFGSVLVFSARQFLKRN